MNRPSFFCYRKHCRKSAWQTPEYLTPKDWTELAVICGVLGSGLPEPTIAQLLSHFLWGETYRAERFFNVVIGWPEGLVYCQDEKYFRVTAVPGMIKNLLPKLKQALADHTLTFS